MAEFTPITTQEELNSVIGERIRRERETVTKEFQGQIAEKDGEISKFRTDLEALNKKLEDANQQISGIPAMQETIRKYERDSVKNKVARETGIPYELAGRLNGETEEEIRKDAEAMRKLIGSNKPAAPLKRTDSDGEPDPIKSAWSKVSKELKGDE